MQPIVWTWEEWQRERSRGNPIAAEAVACGVWLRGSEDAVEEPR